MKKFFGIAFTVIICSLVYSGYNMNQSYKKRLELVRIEEKTISDLEEKEKSGDVQALITLARKKNDGYLGADGKIVRDVDKAIEYLNKADKLGNKEAKSILVLVIAQKKRDELLAKQQQENDNLARVVKENENNLTQFASGWWLDRKEEMKFVLTTDGNFRVEKASFEELDPEEYKRREDAGSEQRYEKYKGIITKATGVKEFGNFSIDLGQDGGIKAAAEEYVSDKKNDVVDYVSDKFTNETINSEIESMLEKKCIQSHGYLSALPNLPQYAQIKTSYPDTFFMQFSCPVKSKLWIAGLDYNQNSILEGFDCNDQNCTKTGDDLTRLYLSRKYPKPPIKILLQQSKSIEPAEPELTDIKASKNLPTKYGMVTIKNIIEDKIGLFVDGKLIFEREYGHLGVQNDAIYHLSDSDVVIIYSDEGGSGTPPYNAIFILKAGSSPNLSEWFQSAIEFNPVQEGNKITIDLGMSKSNHNILIYQNGQISTQKLTDKGGMVDDDTCNYLYNDIYVAHVQKQSCYEPPESVSGMATERQYMTYENDSHVNLTALQEISKGSCKKHNLIKFSEFKALVCEGVTKAPALDSRAMVLKMIEYASDASSTHEQEIQQIKFQIESLPKPEKGNKKAARAINENGLASFKESDFKKAVIEFKEAQQTDKSDVEILGNLGLSYLKQGSLDLAQQTLIEALTMSPGRSTAWSTLGEVYAIKGDLSSAVACFSNTYRFSKDRSKTHQFMK